jgi:DNA-binding beta-propeller fold protein YncE
LMFRLANEEQNRRRWLLAWVAALVLFAFTGTARATEYAYVLNQGSNEISQFSIGPTGKLRPLSPDSVWAGRDPYQMVARPNGRDLYVLGSTSPPGGGLISQFRIGTDGRLHPNTRNYVGTTNVGNLELNPAGGRLYATSGHKIAQFRVGSGGRLEVAPPAARCPGFTGDIAFSPGGKHLYAIGCNISSGRNGVVSQFDVGGLGRLSPMVPPAIQSPSDNYPQAVTPSPWGKGIYVNQGMPGGQADPILDWLQADSDGRLSPGQSHGEECDVADLAFTSDGKTVYGLYNDHGLRPIPGEGLWNAIRQCEVHGNGSLTNRNLAGVPVPGLILHDVAIRPGDKNIYVAGSRRDHQGRVSQYRVGNNGALTPLSPAKVRVGFDPWQIVVVVR